ncbi:unnamed protein product [Prorocentrum cordatum]|uniref:Uncharacterized protein n=1 Tax=Prorocentrum cordatum TaxID=2364126 RepID=A0ABN9U2Z0_9DINO|nr:unnamed protein product [Polarella glacialis]
MQDVTGHAECFGPAMALLDLSSAATENYTGEIMPFTCVYVEDASAVHFGDSTSETAVASLNYQYICVGVMTSTASSTVSEISTSATSSLTSLTATTESYNDYTLLPIWTVSSTVTTTTNTAAPSQLSGSIELIVVGTDEIRNSTEAEVVLDSCGRTLAQLVGVPASYVSVAFAESRRLRAAPRQLSQSVVELTYIIRVPADSDAAVVKSTLESISVDDFEAILQDHIDSSVGEGELSVSVLLITGPGSLVDTAADAPAAGPHEAQGSSVMVVVFLTVGCYVGCALPALALVCWRFYLRAAPREGRARAAQGRAYTEDVPGAALAGEPKDAVKARGRRPTAEPRPPTGPRGAPTSPPAAPPPSDPVPRWLVPPARVEMPSAPSAQEAPGFPFSACCNPHV